MNKKAIIFSITGIVILGLIIIGITYAYLGVLVEGNTEEQTFNTFIGGSSIEFKDLSKSDTVEIIEPGYENIKLFTVKNTGNMKVDYGIYLESVENDFVRKNDVVYTLYRKKGNSSIDVTKLNDNDIISSGIYPSTDMYIKTGETLEKENDCYTYALKTTYVNSLENQDENIGKFFSSKVTIKANMDNNFDTSTLDFTIIDKNLKIDTDTFLMNSDSYGISYYFKGNVENNYLEYLNKCYRIVRIEGDGSIKLILESNSLCSDISSNNALIGEEAYGYDIKDDMTLANIVNENNNGMKKLFDSFLNEVKIEDLKEEVICIGDNEYKYDELGNLASETLSYYYNSYKKIEIDKLPTYICNGKTINSYVYPITLDEVKLSYNNNLTYLNSNETRSWWLSSLSKYALNIDNAYILTNNGISDLSVDSLVGVRPSITLKSTTKYYGGDGSKTNPYIVK